MYCVPMHSRINLDVDVVSLPVQLLKDKKTDREVTWPAVWPGLAWRTFVALPVLTKACAAQYMAAD
jgi:hypothetical protein